MNMGQKGLSDTDRVAICKLYLSDIEDISLMNECPWRTDDGIENIHAIAR